MKLKRTVIEGGVQKEKEEILVINVMPGWKEGTKVTFEGKGDEIPGHPPQDIQFVIKEERHQEFTREGSDLIYTSRITLRDALVGGQFQIQHLNGRSVSVTFAGPITPSHVQVMRYAQTQHFHSFHSRIMYHHCFGCPCTDWTQT
jgi:DnaJ-class molecular chaperone